MKFMNGPYIADPYVFTELDLVCRFLPEPCKNCGELTPIYDSTADCNICSTECFDAIYDKLLIEAEITPEDLAQAENTLRSIVFEFDKQEEAENGE